MKALRWFNLIVLALLLVSCSGNGATPTVVGTPTMLNTPQVGITPAPSVEDAMTAFLEAMKVEDYAGMYAMLAQASRDAIAEEDFSKRYSEALTTMNVVSIEYTIASTLTNPLTAQAAFNIKYQTAVLGNIERNNLVANFSLENGEWHVQWSDGLILPELELEGGNNHLVINYNVPSRGNIYDRNEKPIAVQSGAVALGLIPGQILPDQEAQLLAELSRLTGLRPDNIKAMYINAGPDWYIPVGEITAQVFESRKNVLLGFGGLVWREYQSRYYSKGNVAKQTGSVASQVAGYTQPIFLEEVDDYRRLGYNVYQQKIGRAGIEKWGEPYLAGKNGATLYVANAEGEPIFNYTPTDSQPSQSIYLTIDSDFQFQVQQALDGMAGAAVVIELKTGRVLAMASSPGFDANLFDQNNYNSGWALNDVLTDSETPLFNRAAQGAYPLGSVFKIITMAAALESGVFTKDSTYNCQYNFTDLGPEHILHDWTWEHCQRELATTGKCTTQPSGLLTLPQGLMRSCNPWFYHIGLELFNQGKGNLISDMARAFGLGKSTGIEQVAEAEGNVGDPAHGLMATNIAVGQDPILVTPLQVAVFTAALGNGGTLYRPQLVEKIVSASGDPTLFFQPEMTGTLPITPENLKIITDAMREVVENPRGTARHRFYGLNVPVAGKTGTAESGIPGYPHSWFTGFTMKNDPNKPDIAITVFVQNKGEGSDYAAPIFRRIVEIYFYGSPQSVYWFESNFGITETPTPEGWTPEP